MRQWFVPPYFHGCECPYNRLITVFARAERRVMIRSFKSQSKQATTATLQGLWQNVQGSERQYHPWRPTSVGC
jgi:hypothetical protein